MKKRAILCFFMILTVCMVCFFDISSSASKKIRLNKKQVSLKKKQKYTLKLKGVKSKKVKWSSNNKKIATVKNGIINAKKKGICIITARYAKKKYNCTVKVEPTVEPTVEPMPKTTEIPTVVPAPTEGIIPNYSFSDIDDFSNVRMEAQFDLLDKNTLKLKIINNSGTDVATDNYFVLELLSNDKWNVVNFKENVIFEEVLLLIRDGNDYMQNIDLERYFDVLSKGKYRISKRIMAANQGVVTIEFDIE